MARSRKTIVQQLIQLGLPKNIANLCYLQWGVSAISTLTQDPYSLLSLEQKTKCNEIDAVALHLGFGYGSQERVMGAIRYCLASSLLDGHVYLPRQELMQRVTRLIQLEDPSVWERSYETLLNQRLIYTRKTEDEYGCPIYLSSLYQAEKKIALRLNRLHASASSVALQAPTNSDLETVERELRINLAPSQREAIIDSLTHKIVIITGGPGTGKTTIIRAVVNLWKKREARIKLAAPTGRAAKRLAESTGRKALTIHRLLEYNPETLKFGRDENRPLKSDLLVVDEASMIDTELMASLLDALPPSAHLLIVGDIDQLPSVGPGVVLHDLIESKLFPTIRLKEIFRQSQGSLISINAHKINEGELPDLQGAGVENGQDFFFISRPSPGEARDAILEMTTERIPKQFGLNPKTDVQILSPMYKKDAGVDDLNTHLQRLLNPSIRFFDAPFYRFATGDKIMQTKNDYTKDVFNGDIGFVAEVIPDDKSLLIDFEGRSVPYAWDDLENTALAYAITVHKSQGSEYPAIVVPVVMQHYPMLQRNLLYTAVSRGKHLVILVGDQRALQIAVNNNKPRKRYTGLKDLLLEAFSSRRIDNGRV